MHSAPTEGWILTGDVDGALALSLHRDVMGMPHGLRIACEMKGAGVERIVVIHNGDSDAEDITAFAADPRLAGVEIVTATEPPTTSGSVMLARADRIAHRSSFGHVAKAWAASSARLVKLEGDQHDGVFAGDAEIIGRMTHEPVAEVVAVQRQAGALDESPPPWLGFCVPTTTEADVRRGEALLVSTLKKKADGFAARLLNRHVSLFITKRIARTRITPNAVTVCAFIAAATGGIVIGQGGYWAGVLGMLLVEVGSIVDGIDGELARLRFHSSRLGQWMDTVTDDIANICYWTGVMWSLDAAGVGWAYPVWAATVCCFIITQSIQYYLIARVYDSGDLASIPWAMQSTEFLERRPTRLIPRIKVGFPKLFKRDSAVTVFLVMAMAGFLEGILIIAAVGAISFFAMVMVQIARRSLGSRLSRPDTARAG